jgi:hypothetical protein
VIVNFGHFFENNKNSPKVSGFFPIFINFDINGLGYILGDFFTNPSGHPAHRELSISLKRSFFKQNCSVSRTPQFCA